MLEPVVMDTNVLLDIFVFEDPRTDSLRRRLFDRGLKAVRSDGTLEEFAEVIAREKFGLSQDRQQEILRQWQAHSRLVEAMLIQSAPWKCKDKDDQIFLDLAFTLRPSTLLSKDKQVLKFHKRARQENVVITMTLSRL